MVCEQVGKRKVNVCQLCVYFETPTILIFHMINKILKLDGML